MISRTHKRFAVTVALLALAGCSSEPTTADSTEPTTGGETAPPAPPVPSALSYHDPAHGAWFEIDFEALRRSPHYARLADAAVESARREASRSDEELPMDPSELLRVMLTQIDLVTASAWNHPGEDEPRFLVTVRGEIDPAIEDLLRFVNDREAAPDGSTDFRITEDLGARFYVADDVTLAFVGAHTIVITGHEADARESVARAAVPGGPAPRSYGARIGVDGAAVLGGVDRGFWEETYGAMGDDVPEMYRVYAESFQSAALAVTVNAQAELELLLNFDDAMVASRLESMLSGLLQLGRTGTPEESAERMVLESIRFEVVDTQFAIRLTLPEETTRELVDMAVDAMADTTEEVTEGSSTEATAAPAP